RRVLWKQHLPMPGSRRSRARSSAETLAAGVIALALASGTAGEASAQGALRPFTMLGDSIPESLTGGKGDAGRGRAIIVNRQVGLCLLCHSGPFPEERFQSMIGPDLKGAGARWSEGQLRLRIVDATKVNPESIMPPYYRVERLARVAPAFRGKPILN